jgi:hypothetical protein
MGVFLGVFLEGILCQYTLGVSIGSIIQEYFLGVVLGVLSLGSILLDHPLGVPIEVSLGVILWEYSLEAFGNILWYRAILLRLCTIPLDLKHYILLSQRALWCTSTLISRHCPIVGRTADL